MVRCGLLLLLAACSSDDSGTGVLDQGVAHDATTIPDVAAEPAVCPFDDEPLCGETVFCPDGGGFICVQDDPPADGSTCRWRCETTCPEPCDRVCQPLSGGGAACLPGTGAGEPCSPEPCNPGLDCISDNFGRSFCRTRCGPDHEPRTCVELHFSCNERRGPGGTLLGWTCVPGDGPLIEGMSCANVTDRCDVDIGLICATHIGGTTCVRACDPSQDPDGCLVGETCQAVSDEEDHPIGYACL